MVGTVPGLGKALWRLKAIFGLITDLPKSFQELLFDLLNRIQDELLSFALSKLPDFVRVLKRLFIESAQKLDVVVESATNTPALASASHFTPPPTIGKNATSLKSIKIELPAAKPKPASKDFGTSSTKPKPATGAADNPPAKQPTPEPKKETPPPKPAGKPKPIAKPKKTTSKKAQAPQKKRARKNEKREQRKSRAKAKKKAKAPAKASKPGPLVVVKRRNMDEKTRNVKGQKTTTYGQPNSSSTTAGHADTIVRKANKMVNTGDYDYITMQRSWRTATGRISKERKMPDLIGVRRNGKVDAFEVESNNDKFKELMKRLKEGMHSLPKSLHGQYSVIQSRPNKGKSATNRPKLPKGSKKSKAKHVSSRKKKSTK